jgi:hypothetical protein
MTSGETSTGDQQWNGHRNEAALLVFVVDPRTRRSCMIRPLKRALRSAPKIVGHSMKSLIGASRDVARM